MVESKAKKGVENVKRGSWDTAHYEEQARLRASGMLEEKEDIKKVIKSNKQEFKAADSDAAGPAGSARAYLKSRVEKIELDGNVGKVRIMNSEEANKNGGYYCEVCECTLKDSIAYLDHINGKKHLRTLGYSMRVERSSVESVKNRLKSAAKRKWAPMLTTKVNAIEAYDKKIIEQNEKEREIKRQKKEKKKNNKEQDHKDERENSNDIEMMKLMGFSGFSTSKT